MFKKFGCNNRCDKCLSSLFNAMSEGVALFEVVYDNANIPIDYKLLEVNKIFEDICGMPRDSFIGQVISSTAPEFFKKIKEVYIGYTRQETSIRLEYYSILLDRHFLVSVFSYYNDQIITYFTDITALKRAEEQLKLHEILFENANDIVLYVREDGSIENANHRALEKYGFRKEEILKLNVKDIRHSSTPMNYEDEMERIGEEGLLYECIHVKKNGDTFPVEVSAKFTYTTKGKLRIQIIRDITERKIQEERINWLAEHDYLTGIANRAYFLKRLDQAIHWSNRSEKSLSVMLFDVDKFKSINDQYGHEAGDIVLKCVAERAQKALRQTDVVARLGGDEFVILQSVIDDIEGAETLAKRVIFEISQPVTYNKIEIMISLSLGAAIFEQQKSNSQSLLQCADKAMYEVKRNGGNNYKVYTNTSSCDI